jgi:mono/diheme cytochrome c family protein
MESNTGSKSMKRRFDSRIIISATLTAVGLAFIQVSFAATNPQVAQGKKIFERQTCEGCHPAGGNSLNPTKFLKGPKFQARYKDDASLEKAIRAGFPNFGMPPSAKDAINDKEMKSLIAYIRSLTPKASK